MNLTRANSAVQQFLDFDGTPLSGGRLCTFIHGTTTPIATYKDKNGTLNECEVRLNSRGECDIWLDPSQSYKFVLKRADGSVVWTEDNVRSSAHIPATLPFAIDEDHLKITMVGGVAVLSLADSLVSKLKAKGVDIE